MSTINEKLNTLTAILINRCSDSTFSICEEIREELVNKENGETKLGRISKRQVFQ